MGEVKSPPFFFFRFPVYYFMAEMNEQQKTDLRPSFTEVEKVAILYHLVTLATVEFWGSAILCAVSIGLHLPMVVSIAAFLYATFSFVALNLLRIRRNKVLKTFKPLSI